jgi:AcrR family transcriptional regulator
MTKTRRELILDTAEQLFAKLGFDGVSMRMVADEGEVGLGLLTYHFPTKDLLWQAVFGRRARILNDARKAALAALDSPTLEELIASFFQAYRDFIESGDAGWRAYARLHAALTQDARWTEMITGHFGAVALDMIGRIRRAVPGLDQEAATRGYVLMIGATVSIFSDTGLLDRLTAGAATSRDIGASFDPLVAFAAGGIRALAGAHS